MLQHQELNFETKGAKVSLPFLVVKYSIAKYRFSKSSSCTVMWPMHGSKMEKKEENSKILKKTHSLERYS